MLKNARNDKTLLNKAGCSCCNPKQLRREAKHSIKKAEELKWKQEMLDDLTSDEFDLVFHYDEHIYDNDIYEPYCYSTESDSYGP